MSSLPGSTRKVAGQFFDFGGSSYHTKHPNAGLVLDSITDDALAFDTLVNQTMQPGGGRVDIAGILRIGRSMTIPSNIKLKFIGGAYLSPDQGVTISLNGSMSSGSLTKRFGGGGLVMFGGDKIPCVHPQWWGATGDGRTDDSAFFQAAHDALPPNGGSIVLPVPASAYMLARAIKITKRSRWIGNGGKLSVPIICSSANSAFTALFAGGYLEFENLFVQGANTTGSQGSAFNIAGMSSTNKLTFLRITNCSTKNFSAPFLMKFIDGALIDDVFYFQGLTGVTSSPVWTMSFCVGIELRRAGASGTGSVLPRVAVAIGSNCDTISITQCTFYHSGGILLSNNEPEATFPPRYIKIDSTDVEIGQGRDSASDIGFNIRACQDLRIVNCTAVTGYHGIQIEAGKHVSVIGGSIYANYRHGIALGSKANGVELLGIQIYDNSQAADNTYAGISISDGCTNFSVTGCSVRSGAQSSSGFKHRNHLFVGKGCANFLVSDNRFPNEAGTQVLQFGDGCAAYGFRNNQVRNSATSASFTATPGITTVVHNRCVHDYATIKLTPRNASAAALTGLFVSAKTSEDSFTIRHSTASGTESFEYQID